MTMSEQPITNDVQLQQQREALALIEEIMRGYEHDLLHESEPAAQESIRAKLYRVYTLRYNIMHGIQVYLAQQRQSA